MSEKIFNKTFSQTNYSSISEFKNLFNFPNTKPLVLIDLAGKIKFANNPFEETFQLKENSSIKELSTDPDITIIIENIIRKKFANFYIDLFFRNRQLGYFTEFQRVLIKNEHFFVIVFTSIKEREILEEKINNLHYALEFGYVPVATLSYEGKFTYTTRSFEKLLSKSIQEVYNKHVTEILKPFLSNEDYIQLQKALDKRENWKTVLFLNFEDRKGYYEFILKPIMPHKGKISGFVLTSNEITDHILRIREIENSEKRQRLIINNISEPLIIIKNDNGKFILDNLNEAFGKAFNIDVKKYLQQDLTNFPNEALIDTVLTAIDRINYEKSDDFRFNFNNPETNLNYSCKISTFTYEFENTKLFIISFFDITKQLETERKLRQSYEKEIRLNKLKSAFLANMSHEIRTPLNAIIGYADLLDYEINLINDESLKELTSYLKDGAKRLVKLVENILDVSKIESGDYELNYSLVNVREIFKKIENEFNIITELRGIKIFFKFEEKEQMIETDPTVFEKIFWELIDNAVKYNIENGKIIIHSYSVGDFLRIEVIDTGRGISQDMIKEVLKPFMQDDVSGYRRRYEGAGLGLTLAYKATKLMGGDFEIHSEEGRGAKVIVTLPKKQTTEKNTNNN